MKHTVTSVAKYLRENINWGWVFSRLQHLDKDLNDRMNRHDKGTIIELTLEAASCGILKRVNLKGCDFSFVPFKDVNIENKFQEGVLGSKTGKTKKPRKGKEPYTGQFALANPMGHNENKQLERTFDYLLLIDRYNAALVDFETVNRYTVHTSDQILTKVPLSEIEWLAQPGDYSVQDPRKSSYLKKKQIAMLEYIEDAKPILKDKR